MSKYDCGPGDPLDMLVEECAELIQAAMKLRRFGPDGAPGYPGVKPIEEITREIGDIQVAIERVVRQRIVSDEALAAARARKRDRLVELFGIDAA